MKMMLFDLDGTLLRTDKTISERSVRALARAYDAGYMIGLSTSRGHNNCMKFIDRVCPDVVISSGGAQVSLDGEIIIMQGFDGDEAAAVISAAREICGDVWITADAADSDAAFFRNHIPPQDELEQSWGESVYTDFSDYRRPTLKLCFEIHDEERAQSLAAALPGCDCIRFTDGEWYKFTKAGVTKESAIGKLCGYTGMDISDITAFGDDLADIGMLRMCGIGVAMGNAQPEVKAAADIVIGTNDGDGIAGYIEDLLG